MPKIATKVSEIIDSHLEGRLCVSALPVLLFQWLFPSTYGICFAADRHILIVASWHFRFLRTCYIQQEAVEILTNGIPEYTQAKNLRHD